MRTIRYGDQLKKIIAVCIAPVVIPAVLLMLITAAVVYRDSPGSARCAMSGIADIEGGDVSIMGPPSVEVSDMVTWYRDRGYRDPMANIGTPLEGLMALYWEVSVAEGVRPEVALVQAVLETGGFANLDSRNYNNFAGIGHPDGAAHGFGYGSVEDGVMAHVQLLRKVVEGNDVELALPDAATTWGGKFVDTVAGLTNNWAGAGNYDQILVSMIGQLVDSAGVELLEGGVAPCGSAGVIGGYAFPLPHDAVTGEMLRGSHWRGVAVDLGVPTGTEIYAPVSGRVMGLGGGDCGIGVTIQRDEDNSQWSLCHGSQGFVTSGQAVEAGELIMLSGNTGRSTGPHLHLSIHVGGWGVSKRCPQWWLYPLWLGEDPPDPADLPETGCSHGSGTKFYIDM